MLRKSALLIVFLLIVTTVSLVLAVAPVAADNEGPEPCSEPKLYHKVTPGTGCRQDWKCGRAEGWEPGPCPAEPTPESASGCTDPEAENFDPEAEVDNGSCTYPKPAPEPTPEPTPVPELDEEPEVLVPFAGVASAKPVQEVELVGYVIIDGIKIKIYAAKIDGNRPEMASWAATIFRGHVFVHQSQLGYLLKAGAKVKLVLNGQVIRGTIGSGEFHSYDTPIVDRGNFIFGTCHTNGHGGWDGIMFFELIPSSAPPSYRPI